MRTDTKSRILLTAFLAFALPPGLYFVFQGGDFVIFGWLIFAIVLALLIWIWKPWEWFQKK